MWGTTTLNFLGLCEHKKRGALHLSNRSIRQKKHSIEYLTSSPQHLQHPENLLLQGGGTAMIQAIEQLARKAHVTQLVVKSLHGAQAFYRKQDFYQTEDGLYIKEVLP